MMIPKIIFLLLTTIPTILWAADNADWGWGAQPIIGYDDQEGWTLGASNVFYIDPDTSSKEHEVDEFDLTTTVTSRRSFNVHGEVTKYLFDDTRNIGVVLGCERSFSRYYGPRELESDSVLANYKTIDIPFGVSYSISPFRNLNLKPQYEMDWIRNTDLDIRTDSSLEIPGYVNHDYTSGIGLSIEYNRTNPGLYKRKGYKVSLGSMHYADWLGSMHNFEIVSTNYRHYMPIGKESVFAWQFKYERGLGNVPDFHMPALGSNKLLRGFDDDKYKGKHCAAAQMELRFPLFWRIGATTFWGAGNAADDPYELTKSIHAAGGIGLRFMVQTKQKINIRFDLTYSDEREIQKYIKIKEAF